MKSRALKIVFSVCLSLSIILYVVIFTRHALVRRNNKKSLDAIVERVVSQDISGEELSGDENTLFSNEVLEKNENVIGRLIIDKIKVNGPIVEGTSVDVLKKAIGHFSNSKFWTGNVCLASHNRGSNAHYFEKLNKLRVGDEIKYQTKLGTKVYVVNEINKIKEDDLSVLNNTDNNAMTLITCVKLHPDLRLCVRAIEKT